MARIIKNREGKIATVLLTVFVVAMNPPVVYVANSATTTFGIGTLYLYAIAWGLFAIGVLVWAAKNNAFALTEEEVPPELRQSDDVDVTGGDL
jgi:hypothetical protein